MIVVDVEQNTQAWIEARLGVVTASAMSRIITPGGKLSAQREKYKAELLAEYFLGSPLDDFGGNDAIDWGNRIEPEARKFYGFIRDATPRTVGFCLKDESGMVGASPDALVGSDGLLELKCPFVPANQLLYLAGDVVPRQHVMQLQGQLWVTGREWVDFMSYYPRLPPFIKRVLPDGATFDAFDKHIPVFIDELMAGRKRLIDMGVEPAMEAS